MKKQEEQKETKGIFAIEREVVASIVSILC